MKRTALVVILTLFAFLVGCSDPQLAKAGPQRSSASTVSGMTVTLDHIAPLSIGQTRHNAFPWMAQMPDGTVQLVWRNGKDHATSRDGSILRARSTDGGQTFSSPITLRSGGPGGDYRDPAINYAHGAEQLTWFAGTATNNAAGSRYMREWGSVLRLDTLPYSAITSPVVALPNGELGTTFYARKTGETYDTVWMAWSANDGATWTVNRVVNKISSKIPTNEPQMVIDGTTVRLFFRYGASQIGMVNLPNSGHGVPSAVTPILNSATGRPTTIQTAAGTLVMMYRDLPGKRAHLAYSSNDGVSWTDGGVILSLPPDAASSNGMTYATFVEPTPGTINFVVAMETNSTSLSKLYGGTLLETP